MSILQPAAFAVCALAIMAGGAVAGSVTVSVADPVHFVDAGVIGRDRKDTLEALSIHLQALGQRLLPADQVLTLEVLDVDLAGTLRPSSRSASDLRVLNGGADWPRIKLRYSLQSGGKELQSGEESVTDMNYLLHAGMGRSGTTLYYEKRMLDEWFLRRFGERLN